MSNSETKKSPSSTGKIRIMTGTAMLAAIAYILMFFDFSVPFMPTFIKMDLSELPALIGAFAYGPVAGIVICLIKNLIHLTITTTAGVGELSNFLLGAIFVGVAGVMYKVKKNRTSALIGSLIGAAAMGILSIATNHFLVYPLYYNFMPKDVILAAYQAIIPGVKSILQCLIVFNAPFTFVKGLFSVVITFIVYKRLSPILKGTK